MRNFFSIMAFALFIASGVVVLSADSALAVGFGGYLETTSGTGTFDQFNEDVDVTKTGFGFVMDSNVSKRSVFNYRLHVGFNDMSVEPETADFDIDGNSISIDNAFGFGLVRTDDFRLWLGPEVHLEYATWDKSIAWKDDIDFIGFGLGVVLGANINLPGVVSICPELGFRFQANESDTYEETYYNGSYYTTYTEDYAYEETVVFARLSLLFRAGGGEY